MEAMEFQGIPDLAGQTLESRVAALEKREGFNKTFAEAGEEDKEWLRKRVGVLETQVEELQEYLAKRLPGNTRVAWTIRGLANPLQIGAKEPQTVRKEQDDERGESLFKAVEEV